MSAMAPRSGSPRDVLLCLSHLRWNLVFQRPHHLLTRAARDFQVIYLEEPEFEEGAQDDVRVRWEGDILVATPVLAPGTANVEQVVEARVAQLVGLFRPRRRLVLWYYTPMALPLAGDLVADCVVYDCMDELSLFKNAPRQLRQRESALMAASDLLFTGGESLHEAKRGQHRDAHCFPSSIDTAHFGRARQPGAEPPDQAAIPHPRIGYFGVIDERLDIPLLAALAAMRPDWHFVMLGPVVKIDPADLPRADNIHWLGPKDYAVLPDYLRGWDAGFMPFALNDSTRFISPTKTPEFLAGGLPVVSTPVRDVVRGYGADELVGIAAGPLEMAEALERALASKDDSRRLRAVDRRLATMSWDFTWDSMRRLMEERMSPASSVDIRTEERAHV